MTDTSKLPMSRVDELIDKLDELNTRLINLENDKHIIESWNEGTEWYRVWSDGWIEQGGYIPASTSTSQVNNLLVEMKDTNYNINITAIANSWTGGLNSVFDLTTTSFKMWTSDDQSFNSCPIKWEVKGYKKED